MYTEKKRAGRRNERREITEIEGEREREKQRDRKGGRKKERNTVNIC